MTTENENIKDEELNEAELSDVKNSIASLCKKYLTGSFFDKLVDTSGIKIAKDILLGDLKNMIGKGTSGPAAKKFAIAIQMAKNPVAVDTIMSNYMLKGDGMGSGIGYTESAEIQGFREYLTEAKKGGCCGGKKKPSEEEIEEAIKTVEAEGYKVSRLEESEVKKPEGRPSYYDHPLIMAITYKGSTIYCGAEDGDMWSRDIEDAYVWDSFDTISTIAVENFVAVAKEALETSWISEDNVEYLPATTDLEESKKEKSYVTEEEIEKAKKLVESRGFRVREKKIDEEIDLDMTLEIPAEEAGCDEKGLKDLIDDALAIGRMVDGIDDIEAKNGTVYVHFVSKNATPSRILYDLWDSVEDYIKTASGAEADYGEDVVDLWERAFEKAEDLL